MKRLGLAMLAIFVLTADASVAASTARRLPPRVVDRDGTFVGNLLYPGDPSGGGGYDIVFRRVGRRVIRFEVLRQGFLGSLQLAYETGDCSGRAFILISPFFDSVISHAAPLSRELGRATHLYYPVGRLREVTAASFMDPFQGCYQVPPTPVSARRAARFNVSRFRPPFSVR